MRSLKVAPLILTLAAAVALCAPGYTQAQATAQRGATPQRTSPQPKLFDPMVQTARTPYEGIVEAATKRNCDLILMSSHGERGIKRFLLGSVADKVIQLSKVPSWSTDDVG